jgi:alkylation response protein AidB-like acyl-CoA dehydrogenase
MHIYWTGVAADLNRMGDHTCDWILERAAAGDIFAAGHGEAGNDLPLFLSSSSATKVDGGWEVNGHKIFGTLSPVWTWLGLHAMDTSDPDNPRIVHGFLHRDATGYQIVETWDTLGMRATQSHDTVLDRAFIADDRTPLVCATGMAGAGPFQLSIFAWGLVGFGAVYGGIAQRAFDDTVVRMHERTSVALTRSMAYHPGVQHRVAEMRMALDTIDWSVERIAADWAAGVEHADWPIRLVSMKYTATNNAFKIVDMALDLTGGSGIFKRSRIEQQFRDCRLGRIHPANDLLAHELVGKLSLGINPDEAPRWG